MIIIATMIISVVYYVPSYVAYARAHKNAPAILTLNVLLGWTFIGWVIALVWSQKKD